MAEHRECEFVVSCKSKVGSFPIDMLRYDGCYPLTEEDSWKILNSHDPSMDGPWEIGLGAIRVTREYPEWPTDRRWESFGWKVTG